MADLQTHSVDEGQEPAADSPASGVRRRLLRLAGVLGVVFVLFGLWVASGLPGALGPVARMADGLSLGRYGTLAIEQVEGRLGREIGIGRLLVVDAQGPWLEIDDLRVRPRLGALLDRRVRLDRLSAAQISVLRQPVLGPPEPSDPFSGLPVAIQVDQLDLPLTLAAGLVGESARVSHAFSGALRIERNGDADVGLTINSIGPQRRQLDGELVLQWAGWSLSALDVNLMEPAGGPVARVLQVRTDQPLHLQVQHQGPAAPGFRFGGALRQGASTDPSILSFTGDISATADASNLAALSLGADYQLAASGLTRALTQQLGPSVRMTVDLSPEQAMRSGWQRPLRVSLNASGARLSAAGMVSGPAGSPMPEDASLAIEGKTSALASGQLAIAEAIIDGSVRRQDGQLSVSLSARAESLTFSDLVTAAAVATGQLESGGSAGSIITAGARLRDARWHSALAGDLLGPGVDVALAARQGPGEQVPYLERLEISGSAVQLLAAQANTAGAADQRIAGTLVVRDAKRISPLLVQRLSADWTLVRPVPTTGDAQGEASAMILTARLPRPVDARANPDLARIIGDSLHLEGRLLADQSLDLNVAAAQLQAALDIAAPPDAGTGDAAREIVGSWQLKGPVALGPVEINGLLKGEVQLAGGQINASSSVPGLVLFGEPLRSVRIGVAGSQADGGWTARVTGTAQGEAGPATLRAIVAAAPDTAGTASGIAARDIALHYGGASVTGQASQNGGKLSARLRAGLSGGRWLESGQASATVSADGPTARPRLRIQLAADDARPHGTTLRINKLQALVEGDTRQLTYSGTVQALAGPEPVAAQFDGEIALAAPRQSLTLNASGAGARGTFETLTPITLEWQSGGRAPDVTMMGQIGLDDGRAEVAWQSGPNRIDASFALTDIAAPWLLGPQTPLTGQVSAEGSLKATARDVTGEARVSVPALRPRTASAQDALNVDLTALLRSGRLDVAIRAADQKGALTAAMDGRVPVSVRTAPLSLTVSPDAPLSGEIAIKGALGGLAGLVLTDQTTVAGDAQFNGQLAGRLSAPDITGDLIIANGSARNRAVGLRIEGLEVRASLADGQMTIERGEATDGRRGRLTLSGTAGLATDAPSNLTLALADFRVLSSDAARADLTGDLVLQRRPEGISVSGAIEVEEAEIKVPAPAADIPVPIKVREINRARPRPQVEQAAADDVPITLDIALTARNQIYVRGSGLDAEFSADTRIRGPANAPQLSGSVLLLRGDVQFSGQRFEFTSGRVQLLNPLGRSRLAFAAENEAADLTAILNVSGTIDDPQVSFNSDPALPQDEVLARILFGRSATDLSALEAAQLGAAIASLSGSGGGYDAIGKVRSGIGLDQLALRSDAGGNTVIAVGKQVAENVFLELTSGGSDGTTAAVEWRPWRFLQVVGTTTQIGENTVSVRWRKDVD